MVVDLGAPHQISEVRLTWTPGKGAEARVETSTDGRTYTPLADGAVTARYVAVAVTGWRSGSAGLAELAVSPAEPDSPPTT